MVAPIPPANVIIIPVFLNFIAFSLYRLSWSMFNSERIILFYAGRLSTTTNTKNSIMIFFMENDFISF